MIFTLDSPNASHSQTNRSMSLFHIEGSWAQDGSMRAILADRATSFRLRGKGRGRTYVSFVELDIVEKGIWIETWWKYGRRGCDVTSHVVSDV